MPEPTRPQPAMITCIVRLTLVSASAVGPCAGRGLLGVVLGGGPLHRIVLGNEVQQHFRTRRGA